MNIAKRLVCYFLWLLPVLAQAQETKPKQWALTGYAKSMQGLFITEIPGIGSAALSDNFLHNRLNFRWFPSNELTFKVELRNRFFFGEFSRAIPNFKTSLKEGGNDVLNLQLINAGDDVILHSIIDRLYGEFVKDNWEIRLGRQRINWGINTVWNPHDIFNAFSFTDFDYEERPGSDALRVKYYTGVASSLELAAKLFDDTDEIVAGLLWKANKWNYDFQLLAGWAHQDVVLGAGWAGGIKQLGFNGEASVFVSTVDSIANTFTGTLSLDYSFEKGLFLGLGLLYNGTNNANSNLFAFELNARNLYPYRWSIFNSISYPFNPLITGSFAVIYSPVDGHPLFINPTITYSLAQNIDVNLIGQIVFQGDGTNNYGSPTQVAYLRLKWSF